MLSAKRDFIILIIADDQMKGRGLKANVRFIRQTNDKSKDKNKEEEEEVKTWRPEKTKINQKKEQSRVLGLLAGIV